MKQINLVLFFFILLASCNNSGYNETSIYNYIPNEASIIISINDTQSLETELKNNNFIDGISKSLDYKNIAKKLNALNYIKTEKQVIISLLKDENDSLQFTISTKQIPNLYIIDSLSNSKIKTLEIAKNSVKKITFNKEEFYSVFKDSIAILASNIKLLESVLTQKNNNIAREKIIKTLNKEHLVSLILNHKNNNFIHSFFNSKTLDFKHFSDFTTIDTTISQDEILIDGITKASDSSKKLINIFKNTRPQNNELANIAPNNCDGFLSFTFNEFKTFKANLNTFNTFNTKKGNKETIALFDNIIEIGSIFFETKQAIVLNSLDVISTKESLLSEQNEAETFRQNSIYAFSKPKLFKTVFYPLIDYTEINYYCIIDNFFVFAKDLETLENIITNYQNKTTLSSRDYYKNITKNLSNEASILQVLNNNTLKNLINSNLDSQIETSLNDYKTSALQFVFDTHYAHIHGAIKKHKTKIKANTVTEILNIKLDADVLNNPQFVDNHRNGQKEIIVQDITNTLYLISNTGTILWKKQLNHPVLGEIKQLDTYKNGRLQLAFTTQKSLYLLDRTGKDVAGYPIDFNAKITQPLAVFDYDKNKKYRLLITQDKSVSLFDSKGKKVKGFKFSSAKNTINHKPQHIRLGNKDYILIKTNKELNILNRKGNTRVNVVSELEFSNAPIFNYNNTFTTSTIDGKIISIDQKGNVSTKPVNLTSKHHLDATTKTLVSQNDNILNIKSKTIELDLGRYSPVKIFYIQNKIYVSVTDLQGHKVLLFDSQAKPIENFPVYGNSSIVLDNIDKDKSLEFITKGDSNSLLLYKIN